MAKPQESFTTKTGMVLPLLNLRGKKYLQVAHRIAWLADEVPNYDITTKPLQLEEDSAVYVATISILEKNAEGMWHVAKKATATKSETRKGFADFIEKAETGAIGRALAMLGYGTQFTGDELDEGMRLADSPTQTVSKGSAPKATTGGFNTKTAKAAPAKKRL
jgi:hypothetical protein